MEQKIERVTVTTDTPNRSPTQSQPSFRRYHSAATEYLSNMKPEDLQRLVTVTMPYGKYQGRVIADLPGAYLAWFARKGFPAGELGNLLALMLELDHNGLKPLLDPLRRR